MTRQFKQMNVSVAKPSMPEDQYHLYKNHADSYNRAHDVAMQFVAGDNKGSFNIDVADCCNLPHVWVFTINFEIEE